VNFTNSLYFQGKYDISPYFRFFCDGTAMKRFRYANGELDAFDTAILQGLTQDARMPMRELAQQIGLSAPSTAERVRRLEEAGVIEGYSARINPAAIGLPIGVYLRIRPMPGELERVAALLRTMGEVVSCDRVTGEDCFIAKAMVPSVAHLEALIDQLLPYATTNTSVIVATPIAQRVPGASA